MSMTMEEENIKVAVRIRPIQSAEKKDGDISCVKASADGKEVQVKVGPLEASSYRCNQCFPSDTTQSGFFNECGITELLDSAMKGYRTCAFAFGQTGAGKTFTMVGAPKGASNREKQSGLISRSLEYLFHKLEAAGVQFSIKLSCLEIYHEQVFDLFAEEKDRIPLSVREHAIDGFFIEGCKLVDCINFPIANAALDAAVKNRQIGSHDLNSRSSRSHCLTEIHIEIPVTVGEDGNIGGGVSYTGNNSLSEHPSEEESNTKLAQGEYISRGKISLVDLAGSERLKTTKSTGKVLLEAGFINKSLYVLGKVIAGLIRTNGDLNHKDVPYRDSKLTKLLISSLGGRSRTLLISCVSEAKSNQAETLRTLKFSMSCARIRNKPMKFLDPQEKLILDLKEEIRRLRTENKKLRSNILTAPASTEKTSLLHQNKHHHHSEYAEGDDDNNSMISRAYSAHSSLDKERIQFKPKNGGKIYGARMNTSKSEYMKKLSPLKNKKNVYKQTKKEMSKEEALNMLDEIRSKNIIQNISKQFSTDYNSNEDDHTSLGSLGSAVSRSSAQELEDLVRRRATGPLVFRGQSGIDISPIKETALGSGYNPAQNHMRSMDDALRIEELEKRIARMESGVLAAQQPFPHDHHSYAAQGSAGTLKPNQTTTSSTAGSQSMPLDQLDGYSSQTSLTNKPKKKKKRTAGRPEDSIMWKGKNASASPYIAHLIEKAPKAAQSKEPFGVRIVAGEHADQEITLPGNPRPTAVERGPASSGITAPRAAGRSSAENLRAAVAGAGGRGGDLRSRSRSRSNKTAPGEQCPPVKDLHSSILDELSELGLGPSVPTPAATKVGKQPVPKMTMKTADRDRSRSKSRTRDHTTTGVGGRGRSRSNSRQQESKPLSAASGMKNTPSLPSLQHPPSTGVKNTRNPAKRNPSLPPSRRPTQLQPLSTATGKINSSQSSGNSRSDITKQQRQQQGGPSSPYLSPSKKMSNPAALCAKLEELERSLVEERERMEDNPGEVTAEAEEHYEEVAKQARILRKKLEMSGVLQPAEREEDEEGAPTPEAVRQMEMQMEILNNPLSRVSSSSISTNPNTTSTPVKASIRNDKQKESPNKGGNSLHSKIQEETVTTKSISSTHSKLQQQQQQQQQQVEQQAPEEATAEEEYGEDDFEDTSKPSTARKSTRTSSSPMLLSKDVSRRFEQIELNVPDITKYTHNTAPKSTELTAQHSILGVSDEDIQVNTRSNSMRQTAVAAVHEALSFNYASSFEENHPCFSKQNSVQSLPAKDSIDTSERTKQEEKEQEEEVKVAEVVNSSSKTADKNSSRPATATEAEEEYEDDTYEEDEFAEEEQEGDEVSVAKQPEDLAAAVVVAAAEPQVNMPRDVEVSKSIDSEQAYPAEVVQSADEEYPSSLHATLPSNELDEPSDTNTIVNTADAPAESGEKEKVVEEDQGYEEDHYGDEDFDQEEDEEQTGVPAETTVSPVPIPSSMSSSSSPQPVAAEAIENSTPAIESSTNYIPSNDAPSVSYNGGKAAPKKEDESYLDFEGTEETAQPSAGYVPSSIKASPVPSAAAAVSDSGGKVASKKEDESYLDFEGTEETVQPSAGYVPSSIKASPVPSAAAAAAVSDSGGKVASKKEDESYMDFEGPEETAQPSAVYVPSSTKASVTPDSAPISTVGATSTTPSAAVATAAAKDENDYGEEEFDEYELSFED